MNIGLFRILIFGTAGIRRVKTRKPRTCPLAWLFPRALSVSATNHKKRAVYVIFISVRTDYVHLSCLLSGACFNKKALPWKKKKKAEGICRSSILHTRNGRGLNSETIIHKPPQYIGITSCSLFYTQGYHLNSLPSFGLFSCPVRTVSSKENLEKCDMHLLRMPSISKRRPFVHVVSQTTQTSL